MQAIAFVLCPKCDRFLECRHTPQARLPNYRRFYRKESIGLSYKVLVHK